MYPHNPIVGNFMLNNATASLVGIDRNNPIDLLLEYIAKSNYGELKQLLVTHGYNVENDYITMLNAKQLMMSEDGFQAVLQLHPDRELFEKGNIPAQPLALPGLPYMNMMVPSPINKAPDPSSDQGLPSTNLDLSNLKLTGSDLKKLLNFQADWCIKINLLTISLGLIGLYVSIQIYEYFKKR